MTRDDDNKTPESGEHEAVDPSRAESFARLVDGLLAGDPIPPAMEAGDRTLLETATMIVASTQEVRLSTERNRDIVDEALEQAVTGSPRLSTVPSQTEHRDVGDSEVGETTDVVDIRRRRGDRAVRVLPWVVATVAAAAALLLFISRPNHLADDVDGTARRVATSAQPALHESSRPADALVGQITAESAQLGSERLDMIYADRMAGYRDLTLSGRRAKGSSP